MGARQHLAIILCLVDGTIALNVVGFASDEGSAGSCAPGFNGMFCDGMGAAVATYPDTNTSVVTADP